VEPGLLQNIIVRASSAGCLGATAWPVESKRRVITAAVVKVALRAAADMRGLPLIFAVVWQQRPGLLQVLDSCPIMDLGSVQLLTLAEVGNGKTRNPRMKRAGCASVGSLAVPYLSANQSRGHRIIMTPGVLASTCAHTHIHTRMLHTLFQLHTHVNIWTAQTTVEEGRWREEARKRGVCGSLFIGASRMVLQNTCYRT